LYSYIAYATAKARINASINGFFMLLLVISGIAVASFSLTGLSDVTDLALVTAGADLDVVADAFGLLVTPLDLELATVIFSESTFGFDIAVLGCADFISCLIVVGFGSTASSGDVAPSTSETP
jgi:hypothetical protein